jgi:hypothetical protein
MAKTPPYIPYTADNKTEFSEHKGGQSGKKARRGLFSRFKRYVKKRIAKIFKPASPIVHGPLSATRPASDSAEAPAVAAGPVNEPELDNGYILSAPSLPAPILSKLLPHLPPILREATAIKLRYCSDTHGISLKTLLRHTEGPALLLARTDDMALIGAFSNDGLPITKGYVNKLLIVAR